MKNQKLLVTLQLVSVSLMILISLFQVIKMIERKNTD